MFPAKLRRKALCVGISYKGQHGPGGVPPSEFELAGAHNDVRKVHHLLTHCYDYAREDITVLLDKTGYKPPTKDNMIAAMEALVDGAKPGENLFFFFAGHGDQITNLDGTESDFLDEIILPLDWKFDETRPPEDREKYSQIIIDDDMNNILVKRLPSGCRLTALFDSCHSGTMLDLAYHRFIGPRSMSPPQERYIYTEQMTASPPPEMNVLYQHLEGEVSQPHSQVQSPTEVVNRHSVISKGPLDLSFTYPRVKARGRNDRWWRKGTWVLRGETMDNRITIAQSSVNAEAISWSACSDGQSGYELRSVHENRSGGVMVEAFVGILENKPYQTFREILECLADRLKEACMKINAPMPEDQWILQEPQFGSQQKPDLDKLFVP